jgi:phage shock protein E
MPLVSLVRPGVRCTHMPTGVDRHELQRLVDAGAQLVEVLPAHEYDEQHLPGAISIPLRKIDTEARDRLDAARPVVVYCWDSA